MLLTLLHQDGNNMCYIQLNKNSELVTSCAIEYMISYFKWNISKELVTYFL
jgi:hypothetical protein